MLKRHPQWLSEMEFYLVFDCNLLGIEYKRPTIVYPN